VGQLGLAPNRDDGGYSACEISNSKDLLPGFKRWPQDLEGGSQPAPMIDGKVLITVSCKVKPPS
jgi:hypothetical protein